MATHMRRMRAQHSRFATRGHGPVDYLLSQLANRRSRTISHIRTIEFVAAKLSFNIEQEGGVLTPTVI
jgi:hypothetical protein